MNIFRHRPLCLAAVLFILTGFLCLTLPLTLKVTLGAVLLLPLPIRLIPKTRRCVSLPSVLVCTLCALCCVTSCLAFDLPASRAGRFHNTSDTVEAYVTDTLYKSDTYALYAVRTERIGNETCHVTYLLATETPMEPGQSLRAEMTLHAYPERSYEEHGYEHASGIFGEAALNGEPELGDIRYSPRVLAARCRVHVSSYFDRCFDSTASPLLRAMLLGDRAGLSSQTTLAFRRAGVSHLLALSGMHISILVLALIRLFGVLRVPRRISAPIIMVFIVFYSFLVGLPLSIVRAGTMTAILLVGSLIRRERDALTSLSCAAVFILLVSPVAILDLGFWMSVMATLGILVANECGISRVKGNRLFRVVSHVFLSPLTITLAASLFTLPLVTCFFGELSLLSVPSNLVFPVLLSPLLYLALLSLILPFLRPLTNLAASAYLKLLHIFSDTDGIILPLDSPPFRVFLLLLIACGVFLLVAKLRHPKRMLYPLGTLAVAMVITAAVGYIPTRTAVAATYCTDMRQNDYIVMQDSGSAVVYAATGFSASYTDEFVSELKNCGVYEVDMLCFGHYHESFPRYLDKLLGKIKIKAVAFPPPGTEYERGLFNEINSSVAACGIPLTIFSPDMPLTSGQIGVRALPRTVSFDKSTPARAAALLCVGNARIFYATPGYYQSPAFEEDTLADLDATALIFGRHGSEGDRALPVAYPLGTTVRTVLLCPPDCRMLLNQAERELYGHITTVREPVRYSWKCR